MHHLFFNQCGRLLNLCWNHMPPWYVLSLVLTYVSASPNCNITLHCYCCPCTSGEILWFWDCEKRILHRRNRTSWFPQLGASIISSVADCYPEASPAEILVACQCWFSLTLLCSNVMYLFSAEIWPCVLVWMAHEAPPFPPLQLGNVKRLHKIFCLVSRHFVPRK